MNSGSATLNVMLNCDVIQPRYDTTVEISGLDNAE